MSARALSFAWLSLAAIGCGLAPHDATTPAAETDGTSGFVADGPIELCIGSTRVVSPSVASGSGAGVCANEGATPAACGADGDCRAPESCICGRCLALGCRGASDCPDGYVCSGGHGTCEKRCTADADCAPDEACAIGGCARRCSDDSPCAFGQRCDSLSNTCGGQSCDDLTPCGAGRTCVAEQTVGDVREPSLVTLGGARFAYVEVRTRANGAPAAAIYRARIATPHEWIADPETPVLAGDGPNDAAQVGAPSALVRGAGVELYFATAGGASIERATSDDGVGFVRDGAPLLVPSAAWEAGYVGSPGAVVFAGATYLFYEAGGGTSLVAIGAARLDGASATRLRDAPVLAPGDIDDPIFWRGVSAVGTPAPVVVDDVLRLYFTGRGTEGTDAESDAGPLPADPNDSIGLATTRDLVHFDRFPTGPAFARRTNLRAYLGEREPSVTLEPGERSIAFVASDASGTKTVGLSRATTP